MVAASMTCRHVQFKDFRDLHKSMKKVLLCGVHVVRLHGQVNLLRKLLGVPGAFQSLLVQSNICQKQSPEHNCAAGDTS